MERVTGNVSPWTFWAVVDLSLQVHAKALSCSACLRVLRTRLCKTEGVKKMSAPKRKVKSLTRSMEKSLETRTIIVHRTSWAGLLPINKVSAPSKCFSKPCDGLQPTCDGLQPKSKGKSPGKVPVRKLRFAIRQEQDGLRKQRLGPRPAEAARTRPNQPPLLGTESKSLRRPMDRGEPSLEFGATGAAV